jgi:hypothetical protein
MRFRASRMFTARVLACALVAAATTAAWAVNAAGQPSAVAASGGAIDESAHLRLASAHGASFTEQGLAAGTLRCTLTLYLRTTSRGATFRLEANSTGGSITGSGSARIDPEGKDAHVSGTAAFTRGSGRYSRVYAVGLHVAGVFNRETNSMSVTLSGHWSY